MQLMVVVVEELVFLAHKIVVYVMEQVRLNAKNVHKDII